jgi:hypothetical protein
MKNPEWHFYENPFWRKVTLTDGTTKRGGLLMRRFVNGRPEFRELTKEEGDEWNTMMAW